MRSAARTEAITSPRSWQVASEGAGAAPARGARARARSAVPAIRALSVAIYRMRTRNVGEVIASCGCSRVMMCQSIDIRMNPPKRISSLADKFDGSGHSKASNRLGAATCDQGSDSLTDVDDLQHTGTLLADTAGDKSYRRLLVTTH